MPADVSAKEVKEPPRACEGQTKDRVHARVSRDETKAQHAGHGHDGKAQTDESSEENVKQSLWPEAKNKSGKQSGDEAPGSREIGRASCRERVEVWGVAGCVKKKRKK